MILFLDFDGVLHPDEAYLLKGRPVLRNAMPLTAERYATASGVLPNPSLSCGARKPRRYDQLRIPR